MANLSFGNKSTGVKTAWSQADLTLAVGGGDSRYIRLWDASQELNGSPVLDCRLKGDEQRLPVLVYGDSAGVVNYYQLSSPQAPSRLVEFKLILYINYFFRF